MTIAGKYGCNGDAEGLGCPSPAPYRYITKEDIVDFLGDIPQSYIDNIMDEADLDQDNKISYQEFLGLWDQEGDEKRCKDEEDVKKRRHRRANSNMSELSELSDDEFDELALKTAFSFEQDEIKNMLQAPETPVSGKRVSAANAFALEKERSTRVQSLRQSSRKNQTAQGQK